MPDEIQDKIRDAEIEQERTKPREVFSAKQRLEIATPRILVANILLADLRGIIQFGLKKMGFEKDDGDILEGASPKA